MAIVPDTVHWEHETDLWQGVHIEPADLLILPMAVCRWGIAPLEEGLTGRGVEHPPPLSLASQSDTLFPWEVEPPPPPGRLRGLLPPPPEGAGSDWR